MAKIVVVDDHAATRDLMCVLLRFQDHQVIEAADGVEGLLATRAERPDLVITDIVMPRMDGYEMVSALRADPDLAATTVMFHTANYLEEEVRRVARATNVRHVLLKTGDPHLILATVHAALSAEPAAPALGPDGGSHKEYLRALSAKLAEKLRELEDAQAALQSSEAAFRTLTESSPVGMFSATPDGEITYANPRLREIFGMPAADAVRAAPTDPGVREVIRSGGPFPHRMRIVRPDGERRWADVHAAPIRGHTEDAATYVGTVEDVTGLVTAQQQEAVMADRLHASERLESLGQLAAGIAHDFNNLLAVILNYASLIGTGLDGLDGLAAPRDDAERVALIREDADRISDAAKRAADLTRQLLIFGRRQVVHREIIDPNELVRGIEQLLGRTIGEHIALEARLDRDAWTIEVDRSRMEQVLVNLVVNARDAIRGHGTVILATANVNVDDDVPDPHAPITPGRYVRLTVTDDGGGMAPEVAARAFEPFFTTKPTGEGTGLGLATVYGVVKQLGGHVEIASRVGEGTTVLLYVPAASRPAAVAPGPAIDSESGRGETVLVVEDEEALRIATARILTEHGYSVLSAVSGAAAIDVLHDHAVDLVLTDVVMPGMSGAELAERIDRQWPDVPVMFMSGYADDLHERDAVLIEKPFTPASLLGSVSRALAERTG